MRSLIYISFLVMAACGGKGGGKPAEPEPDPQPKEEEAPTSFGGASRTWEVNYQSEDNCTFVDVTVCPEGGDIETCDPSLLTPYECPTDMGSPPWFIYEVNGLCWFHAEPQAECEGPQCTPAFTGKVDCPA